MPDYGHICPSCPCSVQTGNKNGSSGPQMPTFPDLTVSSTHILRIYRQIGGSYYTCYHFTSHFSTPFQETLFVFRFCCQASGWDGRWNFWKYLSSTFQSDEVPLRFAKAQVSFNFQLLLNTSAFSQAVGIQGPRASENSNRCQTLEINAFLNLGTTNYSHQST